MRRVERALAGDPRVASVHPPPPRRISPDGHTAVITAGAKGDPTTMVAAATSSSRCSSARAAATVTVSLTGSPAVWNEFNTANKSAMMKSELLSWPVTMAIIVLAFGSLVAAGLPLLLTILGLVASAGLLALLTGVFDISIWAMNFALMFSLALGIDYALFIVHRFRASLPSRFGVRDAVVVTMDTAGQAVLFSATDGPRLALGRAARAQSRVPVDGARDHAQRRLRARGDADPPARRAGEAGPRVDALPLGRRPRRHARRCRRAGPSGSGASVESSGRPRRSCSSCSRCPCSG